MATLGILAPINKVFTVIGISLAILTLVIAIIMWRILNVYFSNNTTGFESDREQVAVNDHQIKIKGLNIHYTTSGEQNTQPLVLLQGIGGPFDRANENNLRIHAVLSKNFRLYVPEHPNHRRSDTVGKVWSYTDYKEYIEEFIEKLEIENPVIVGQSFGGKLAQVYAIDNSDEIKLLVIGDASTSFDEKAIYERLAFKIVPLGAWLMKSELVPKSVKNSLVRFSFSIPEDKIDTNNYEKYVSSVQSLGSISEDYSEHLSGITVPTIIIWGEKDMQFPPEQGKKLHDRLPNSELHVFEGATHTAMYQQPQRTLEIILNKLKNID